jgi:hypothetical protein
VRWRYDDRDRPWKARQSRRCCYYEQVVLLSFMGSAKTLQWTWMRNTGCVCVLFNN